MLRITMQDSPEVLTFLVEGKLVGAWAKELEQSWRQAASIRGHRALIIDLSEALFIDGEGRRILAKLFREGAFFRTAGPMTESIVSEITGKSNCVLRGALLHPVVLDGRWGDGRAQPSTQPAPQPPHRPCASPCAMRWRWR